MPKEPKPKIVKVVRTDGFVDIKREVATSTEIVTTPDPEQPGKTVKKAVTNSRTLTERAHEAPLPAFDDALQGLAAVAAKVLDCDPDWKKGITVVSLGVSYTEHGIRSAQIGFVKSIAATGALHPLKTPFFQIDDGKTTDQGRKQCAPKHAELVIDFLKEAQKYALGERSQQLLSFEDGDAEDNVEKLPGMDDDAP